MSNDSKIKLHQGAVVANCYLNKKHKSKDTTYDCNDFEKNIFVQIGEIAFTVDDNLNVLCASQYPFVRTSLNKIPIVHNLTFQGIIQNDVYPDKEYPSSDNVNIFISGLIPILNTSKHTIERGDYIAGVEPVAGVSQYPPNYHGPHNKSRYVIATTPIRDIATFMSNHMSICVAQSMAPPGKIFYGLIIPNYQNTMELLTNTYLDKFGLF